MWIPRREDYVGAAAVVLGLSYRDVERLPGLTLAESALAAPFASFGGAHPTSRQMPEPSEASLPAGSTSKASSLGSNAGLSEGGSATGCP